MAFDRKLLHEHEELVLDLRPHWWFMAWPTLSLAASSILGLWLVIGGGDSTVWDGLKYLAVLGIIVSLGWFAVRYARWITTNFVVTSDRLIYRSGLIAKQGIEIPLERVNTVFFNQGVFERMLGAGDLSIESGGETGKQNFRDIRRPSAVQNEIYKQMEANENRKFDRVSRGAPPATDSIPDQIAKLDQLRQQGALTQAEFDSKKQQLLDRM